MIGLKKFGILALLVFGLFITGCVTIDEHVKVNKDGEIEDFWVSVTGLPYIVKEEGSLCKGKGLSNYKESKWVLKDRRITNDGIVVVYESHDMICKEYWFNNKTVKLVGKFKTISSESIRGIKITKENGYIIFEQYSKESSDATSVPININVYLEMPGKIVESNADKVEGNKAEWHLTPNTYNKITKLYAKSEIPLINSRIRNDHCSNSHNLRFVFER